MILPAKSLPALLATEYRRFGVRSKIVLAVSGGADSLALFRGSVSVATELGLSLVVAHLDHGLRPESADEAAWLTGEVTSHGIECVSERCDVGRLAAIPGQGLEETARRVRYDFLRKVALSRDAATIATAHTGNDQAETVLFQILRGSGLRGLRGIPRRRRLPEGITIVRPLLDASRGEIEEYLSSIGQQFLVDPSNADPTFTRNRLRHDLIPKLRETINPRADASLRRLARHADEASKFLTWSARRELKGAAVEISSTTIRLRSRRLRCRPRSLIRETISLAWRRAGWPRQTMGFAHWDALADLVLLGGRRTLPGGTDARRSRGELILKRPTA